MAWTSLTSTTIIRIPRANQRIKNSLKFIQNFCLPLAVVELILLLPLLLGFFFRTKKPSTSSSCSISSLGKTQRNLMCHSPLRSRTPHIVLRRCLSRFPSNLELSAQSLFSGLLSLPSSQFAVVAPLFTSTSRGTLWVFLWNGSHGLSNNFQLSDYQRQSSWWVFWNLIGWFSGCLVSQLSIFVVTKRARGWNMFAHDWERTMRRAQNEYLLLHSYINWINIVAGSRTFFSPFASADSMNFNILSGAAVTSSKRLLWKSVSMGIR